MTDTVEALAMHSDPVVGRVAGGPASPFAIAIATFVMTVAVILSQAGSGIA